MLRQPFRVSSYFDRFSVFDKTTLLSVYLFTRVLFVYADAGSARLRVERCQRILPTTLHIVRKARARKDSRQSPAGGRREIPGLFHPYRRLAHDYKRHPATAEAMIRWAAISGMVRRLTRGMPAIHRQAYAIN
ncbi:hypothetical protein [Hamadaea tsunoensis]|uniref:hypothetical protein n=1 Tax=Hamadaea tsunoensis TaxID=53368 RepID=UPI000684ADB8|nr:hypothetical protein [Hamadaea tsunoensis]